MLLLEVPDSFWGSERLDCGKCSGYVKPNLRLCSQQASKCAFKLRTQLQNSLEEVDSTCK